jgi:hypothetical protein
MRVAAIEMQRALILGLHTGQREGDLLRLPWFAYDGTRIVLRQGKARRGGKQGPLVEIPCTAALRRMLDGMDRVSPLILTTKTGQSLKKRYFARLWDEAMDKAGLQSVTLPAVTIRFSFTSTTCAEQRSLCFRRRAAHRNRSPPSRAIRSKLCIGFLRGIWREHAALPNRQSLTSRTHREQSLQTNCKPSPCRRQ